jgi:hypothetical protein
MADEAPKKPQSFKDINIYSRKFLLCLAACVYLAYGMYNGLLPWKDGANYIAWIVAFYCAAEGYADGKGNSVGQVLGAALGAGMIIAPKVTEPKPPKEPKEPEGETPS